jgi:hypothetical protein
MIKDPDFYTVTMARIYEEQGYWNKAAEIYRYLLKEEPGRKDLAEALAELDRRMEAPGKKKPDDLIPLFREWINLLFRYKQLRKLRNVKNRL